MSKLLPMLSAFTVAFSIGIATAADNPNTDQQSEQPQTQTETPTQSDHVPATMEQREMEYFAAVTKCERITSEDEKQKCFAAAREKHGEL